MNEPSHSSIPPPRAFPSRILSPWKLVNPHPQVHPLSASSSFVATLYLPQLRTELDEVLPDGRQPDYEDCRKLTRTRLVVAESLRMYPQPPVLLRRALEEVPLPKGLTNAEVKIVKGMDVIISVCVVVSLCGSCAFSFQAFRSVLGRARCGEALGHALSWWCALHFFFLACRYNLHRHPDLWDEPDKFNPDRRGERTRTRGHVYVFQQR